MERYVDALERDRCEATLEVEWLWLGFCLLSALLDDLDKMGFDILQR